MNYDIDFRVPFRHRLRFTHDLSGQDGAVLLDLIDPEEVAVANVLVVADRGISNIKAADGQQAWLACLEHLLVSAPSIQLFDCDAHALDGNDCFDSLGRIALMDGGEDCKNDRRYVEAILKLINRFNMDRRSYIVAIGGGAVLDTVGYAAAIAHRGIRLIRIPTTTLAQDDSGVGVKNAINYFNKKNWLGSFAVPWGVINDAYVLTSLPDRDFHCGFSEAVKVSLLKSKEDFDFLCDNAIGIFHRDMEVAFDAIKRSCLWHLKHITQGGDPFEALEARPLDFGHWSAHRMEALTQFEIRHGEAVGIGVAIDCIYSKHVMGMDAHQVDRVLHCLHQLGLPLWHPVLEDSDRILKGLEEFRQHLGGRLTVTMLEGVAAPIHVHHVDEAKMKQSILELKNWTSQLAERQKSSSATSTVVD